MRRLLLPFLVGPFLVGALCVSASAQNPRPSSQVNIGTIGGAYSAGVATDGDLAAIVYGSEFSATEVYCVTSDGRGLTWSAPVRVDSDPGLILSSKEVYPESIAVSGDKIYLIWEDERDCGFTNLYFTRSTDRGVTFETDVRLDVTPAGCQPEGNRNIIDWDTAYSGDNVYIIFLVDEGAVDEVYVMTSNNGGVTFATAFPISTQTGVSSVELVEIAAEGTSGYATWIDTRPGSQYADVYFRRVTSDGLVDGSEIKVNSSVSDQADADGDLEIEVSGSLVVVAFHESGVAPITFDMNRVAVSTDGGVSFASDVQVGMVDPLIFDADDIDLAISNGNIVMVWDDNRNAGLFLGDDIITSYSSDNGVTWSTDLELTTGLTGENAAITYDANMVAVTWEDDDPVADTVSSFFTRDGGVTWTGPVAVSDNPGDCDDPAIAYNSLYGNFVFAWPADDFLPFFYENDLFAGGYRPQTLAANGFVAGPTMLNFDLSLFSGTEPFAAVLATGTPGGPHVLPFGDGRATGLTEDFFFDFTLGQITTTFFAVISPGGAGSTPAFPADLAPGFSISFVGLSYDTAGGIAFGEITDLTTVVVPMP